MPLAMLIGGLFYPFFSKLAAMTPCLIFCMLLITYCRLAFRDMTFSRLHFRLLGVQVVGSFVVYVLIVPFDPLLAEGMMICVLAPTAVAATVITGMLGGSVACLAAYTLISNLCVACISPFVFSFIGTHQDVPFWDSFCTICRQVVPLLILPLAGAWVLERFIPLVHRKLKRYQSVSFYLWSLGLTIVTGKTVSFIVEQSDVNLWEEIRIGLAALVLCCLQFMLGRYFGKRYGEVIAGGQGLGQKNTILAIWMAQVYLSPLSSIGPAAYVLWQNGINSCQLWKKRKDEMKYRI